MHHGKYKMPSWQTNCKFLAYILCVKPLLPVFTRYRWRQAFFETYGTMVRFNCTQTTRQLLAGEGCPGGPHLLQEGQSLQDFALRWLLAEGRGKLDTVLVGLPQGRHVDAALALLGDEEGEGEG
mmetsp:Transcript_51539/g.75419  ORF Transcript_51539/g.75419 Transcript_51539/m.75419 type:complete len:124 (+) Transcript_51539:175-546(+)